MYIVEVTKRPLGGTPHSLPHCHAPLSTHGLLGDLQPISTEDVIYVVVANHNLHTWTATHAA